MRNALAGIVLAAAIAIGSPVRAADVAYPLSEEEIEALAHYLAHL